MLLIVFAIGITCANAIPELIPVQGKLTNASNQALTGSYSFRFVIYDTNTSGKIPLWAETRALSVSRGVFNAVVGDLNTTNPITTVDFNSQRWMGIFVDGEEQLPLIKIASSPSALRTKTAYDLNIPDFNQTYYTQTDANNVFIKTSDSNNASWISSLAIRDWNKTASILQIMIADANNNSWLKSLTIRDWNTTSSMEYGAIRDMNKAYYTQTDANSMLIKISDTNNAGRISSTAIRDWNTTSSIAYAAIASAPWLLSADGNLFYWKQTDMNKWVDQNLQTKASVNFGGLTINTGVISLTGPASTAPAAATTVLTVVGGAGGNGTNGGTGGGIALTTGGGGTGTAVSNGNGGDFNIITGNGANGALGTVGGVGGRFFLTAGNGGSTGTYLAGAGGAISITAGNGGAEADDGMPGAGGAITFTSGTAGTEDNGAGANGGNISLITGAGNANGSYGNVLIAQNGGKVGIGSATVTNTPNTGLRSAGGVVIGADSTNNLIDDASNGSGSSTLYIGNSAISMVSDTNNAGRISSTAIRDWNTTSSMEYGAIRDMNKAYYTQTDANNIFTPQRDLNKWIDQNLQKKASVNFGGLTINTGVISLTGPASTAPAAATTVLTVVGGAGGNGATGGAGSGGTFTGGAGGTSTGTTATGGAGAGFTFTGGTGGTAWGDYSASGNGGAGGTVSITGGLGGSAIASAGGVGGRIILTSGRGGERLDSAIAGNGGDINITTGAYGVGGLGAVHSGNIHLIIGSGSGATWGNIYLAQNGGKVVVGSAVTANTPDTGLRSAGGVVIGADSTNNLIDEASNGGGTATLYIGNQSIDVGGASDIRLKENVVNADDISIDDLLRMRVIKFNFIPEYDSSQELNYGMIAQEVQEIYPFAVKERSDGYLMIDYKRLIPLITKSIQDLSGQVQELRSGKTVLSERSVTAEAAISEDNNPSFFEQAKSALASLGFPLENGIARLEKLDVNKLRVKTARIDKMEMVDQNTLDVYCTWIENGEWKKTNGECGTMEAGVNNQPPVLGVQTMPASQSPEDTNQAADDSNSIAADSNAAQ